MHYSFEQLSICLPVLFFPEKDSVKFSELWPVTIINLQGLLVLSYRTDIGKARNRRVFDNKILLPAEVLQEIKAKVHCRTSACGRPELSLLNV